MLKEWDVIALDEKNRRNNGVFFSPEGSLRVTVVKDKLRISHCGSLIGYMDYGKISIFNTHIYARACKGGLFFAVYTLGQQFKAIAGLAVPFRERDGKWCGATGDSIEDIKEYLAVGIERLNIPKRLSNLDWSGSLKINQGSKEYHDYYPEDFIENVHRYK